MATVKGDVHDIGKNIVGVVLGCNNYEVIDLGVMVPQDKILQTALEQQGRPDRPERADHAVARRDGVRGARRWSGASSRIPLLIGGATTSRQHTAVKIAPEYSAAGRARARRLARGGRRVEPARATRSAAGVQRRQPRRAGDAARAARAARRRSRCCTLAQARAQPARHRLGRRGSAGAVVPRPRARSTCRSQLLVPFIDWTFFFTAWELKGRVPAIFEHPQYGAAARELYDNAQALLDAHRAGRASRPRGRLRLLAGRVATATTSSCSPTRRASRELLRFHMLRQQEVIADDKPNRSPGRLRRAARQRPARLPRRVRGDRRPRRRRRWSAEFERDHDDYHAIMVKALADRLAEAFAEYLHARGATRLGLRRRRAALDREDLVGGEVPRHPARRSATRRARTTPRSGSCSTCSARTALGMSLTESFAMMPAASVSGLYFAHPRARYFMVGRLGATRSRTTRGARASTSRKPSGGSRRTSRTSRDR